MSFPGPRIARCVFDPGAINLISRHLCAAYPNEGCGMLTGSIDLYGTATISRAACTRNAEIIRGADRFSIDPRDMLALEKELSQAKNIERVIGFFHSHPDAPPTPSRTDLEMALGAFDVAREFYVYMIGRVSKGKIDGFQCWQLDEGLSVFVKIKHAET